MTMSKLLLKIMFPIMLLLQLNAYAGIEPYKNFIKGTVKAGDSILVKDEKFRNTAFNWSEITNISVNNAISLQILDEQPISQSFSCAVKFRLEYFSSPGQQIATKIDSATLNVNYDKTSGASYKGIDIFNFQNGYEVKLYVLRVNSPEFGSNMPPYLLLTNLINIERTYQPKPQLFLGLNGTLGTLPATGALARRITSGTPQNNGTQLRLTWGNEDNPDEYDLEWTPVDAGSEWETMVASLLAHNDTYSTIEKDSVFRNNATRITTREREYTISLIYDSPYLMVRIRPVYYQADGLRIEGAWNYQQQNQYDFSIWSIARHQAGLNWQYSAAFAEQGKKKEVVSYSDGALRARQTVTVANSDNADHVVAVVQENVYDEFGRPAASILPAPEKRDTTTNYLHYFPAFNRNTAGAPYSFADLSSSVCEVVAAPLNNAFGASRYYSPNNPFRVLKSYNNYIPDAQSQPISVTRYTPDQTGRIREQGGVGPTFQTTTSGHTTKYFYSKPEQWEVDRIFGNDVGYAAQYFKNMVVDPNGQVSVSYLNGDGKTIATALTGAKPANLSALEEGTNPRSEKSILIKPEEFVFNSTALTLTATAVKTVAVPGTFKLDYNVEKLISYYPGGDFTPCSNCHYKLKISVKDECLTTPVIPDTFVDVGPKTADPNGAGTHTGSQISLNLQHIGEYYITFELSMDKGVIDFFADQYISQGQQVNKIDKLYQYALKQFALTNFEDCFTECGLARTRLGTAPDFIAIFNAKLLQLGEKNENLGYYTGAIEQYYQRLFTKADSLDRACVAVTAQPCAAYRQLMLADVTPGGQYATIDQSGNLTEPSINVLTLYYRTVFPVLASTHSTYQANQITREDGTVTSVNASDFSSADLVKYWKAEWAEKFLEYHPEYCKLLFCEQNSISGTWDERLRNIQSAVDQAAVSGQTYSDSNPIWLLAGDPFFAPNGKGKDYFPNMQASLNAYSHNILKNYSYSLKNISQMVDYQLYCSTEGATTNTGNVYNNWDACSPKTDCRLADREWQTYRDMYLDLKNIYVELLRKDNCGADCVAATTLSVVSSNCESLNLNYTATNAGPGQYREFNYALNQQTTYTLVAGNASSVPNIYSYCTNASYTPVFYPCLSVSLNGSTNTFNNVWLMKCIEVIQSSCQSSSLDLIVDYQQSNNVFIRNSGTTTVTYTIHEGYTIESEPSFSCAGNQDQAPTTYYECVNVNLSNGYTQQFSQVWVSSCFYYGSTGGGGNPGGGGDPCDTPVAYRAMEANLEQPCTSTISRMSRSTASASTETTVTPAKYVADVNTKNIYRISQTEQTDDNNPKLPADRFTPAEWKDRFVVEVQRTAFATYRNVWVAEFIPDTNTVNGKRNQYFSEIMGAATAQKSKVAARSSAAMTTNNMNSGSCVIFSDTETSNSPSYCNANGTDHTNTSYLIMTDGNYVGAPAPNDVTVRVRYSFNPAVGEGGTPVTLYENIILPAGQSYVAFEYLSSSYVPKQGIGGCYLQQRTFECVVSITGAELCNQSLCTNTANCAPAYQGKVSRFINTSGDLSNVPVDAGTAGNTNEAELTTLIADACTANATEALRQLGLEDDASNAYLKAKLAELCTKGGSQDRLFGASTIPVPASGNYNETNTVFVNNIPCWSYEAILKAVFGSQFSFTNQINPWVIDSPYPHEPKAQLTEKVISATSEDICNKLSSLNPGILNAQALYPVLKAQFGNAMNLTAAELQILMDGCYQCKYLLKENIVLPVFLDVSSTGCISYAQYETAKNNLSAKFGQPFNAANYSNYEKIVTNYMNFTFGFALPYSKYAAFTSGTLCNEVPFTEAKIDAMDCLRGKIETAFGTAENYYNSYIEGLKKDFRTAYINTCAAAKTLVECTGTDEIYHYTLYYYDQAGNLIRTVPPAGVSVLGEAEMKIVAKSRDQKESDYCAYVGPDDNSSESEAFQAISDAIAAPGGSAIEFWMYSPDSGNRQFMATTPDMKYMLQACMADNRVNVDIYTITQNSASSVSIILSNHVTADLGSYGPLAPWAHLVVQGANLANGALAIYVNGRAFTPVSGAPTAGCGWSMSGPASMPKNMSAIKYLRTYKGRLMTDAEILSNALSGCFAISNTSNVMPFRFNKPQAGGPTTIADHGSEETPYVGYYPTHRMATSYVYNSNNQVVKQVTPDAGISRFWYDPLGRLVFSQNARQQPNNSYSYTKYDSLNRITEVGLKTVGSGDNLADQGMITMAKYQSMLALGNNTEITQTYYDSTPSGSGILSPALDNSAKRVTGSVYRESQSANILNGTYYSYDVSGNVKTLYQQINGLGLKRIDYEYDLVSGKVNFVSYQKGSSDKFFYEYKYDAENRLISAWTATKAILKSYGFDSQLSEPDKSLDARYEYYLHGPLARLELGRQTAQVQGLDYAYTLQGWLKGVNGSALNPASDIGGDNNGGLNSTFAKDVLGYSLGYYQGDYQPVGGGNAFSAYASVGSNDESGKSLYNGNISNSTYAIAKIASNAPTGYTYAYDQLNRIKLVRQQENIGTNGWSYDGSSNKFKETFSFDANGNIKFLTRRDQDGYPMDEIIYNYNKDVSGRLINNRLAGITDNEGAGSYKDPATTSYRYDAIGNLVSDSTEGIEGPNQQDGITWNVYGKIKSVIKNDFGGATLPISGNISYTYDASGNRVSKTYVNGEANTSKTDWYVRDAQGNILAEYSTAEAGEDAGIRWREQHLYGSSRLGMWKPNIKFASEPLTKGEEVFGVYGKKFFELNNHLGNTMAVINDVRDANDWNSPTVIQANDYYAYGGQMPGRSYSLDGAKGYRYGFNGKENDNEVKGAGNQQDYGMRIYDPRIAKFLSVDPISDQYPSLTPYQFASNRPIDGIDIDGKEYGTIHVNVDGVTGKNTANYTPYDPTNLHLYGSKGKGVSYDITRYTKNPNGKITLLNKYQIFTERNAKAGGLVPTEYGNYYGATGLFEVSKAFGNTNVPSYAASPIDAVDYAAMIHDIGYDKLNAAGPNSLFNDWGTTPVDENALNSWNSFLDKYKKGDTDPFSKQKVTSDETGAAWRGAKLFGGIVDAKKADISAFIRSNHSGIAYKGPMSARMNAKQLKAMNEYNYGQFLKIYMIKDKDGSYTRTPGKWTQDKNGDWKPKAK